MVKKTKNPSKAASGTKQVWLKDALHTAVSRKAKADHRQIRATVELLLVKGLGYATIEELEADLAAAE